MTSVTARRVALDALVRIEDGAYAHVLVPQLLRTTSLAPRDRAFVTDLVYGTVRGARHLDWLLDPVSTRPVAQLDRAVRAAVRLGAYQLIGGVAEHAAVGETVAVAPRTSRGYVNAVLRALSRLGPPWPEPEDPAIALSYPEWLVQRLCADLGRDDALEVLRSSNEPARLTVRPAAGTTTEVLVAELEASGIEWSRGQLVPDALVLHRSGDPAALPAIREGRATPQDQASQAVVHYVMSDAPASGDPERILDVAAAPGGKATGMAAQAGAGMVVAADLHHGRLRLAQQAAVRLGLANLAPVVADGAVPPFRVRSFDRVLVDAPCSGLGVLRRRPDARWRIDQTAIDALAALQQRLVLEAAALVRPGGLLVYSVCTLTTRETVDVATAVRRELPDLTALTPPGSPWRQRGDGALLLPQDAGTDGMFVVGWRVPD